MPIGKKKECNGIRQPVYKLVKVMLLTSVDIVPLSTTYDSL